ncbi:transcriptional regulator [Corynebacterium frankenforstense DSM 45800]|uniref:Transcriptional regulator n=1 Tax=Corynebacterium frankenforstense DSM 45800 TaxID=1437875 RepID=A0A1L7CUD0_9CORY|nr:TetR/AcrR family transcriptional regulator [Corynebacterium frankenforstense]APT89388.1 transcriptional regulator [Corynebacterium frankenforstense DSM 45800]
MANTRRRDQIAQAAMKLFAERGYHGTGMEDIARECGMRASSLYNHVDSKQRVLAELCIHWMGRLLEVHDAAVEGIDDPAEALAAAMRSHVVFHAHNARAVKVVNNEINSLEKADRDTVTGLRRDYVVRWQKIVAAGIERGEFHVEDLKIAVYALIDMGIGVALWFDPAGRYPAEDLAEFYATAALRQVGAAVPAA